MVLYAASQTRRAACPACGQISTHTHGGYTRRPQDLPCSDHHVTLVLTVRRFRCCNPACPKRTFAERFGRWLPAYARRTERLTRLMRRVGFEVSAESGRRLLRWMRVQTSGDTLLRMVKATPASMPTKVKVVGLDDWAIRKGHTYGSILVDQETHQVVELVPGRAAEDVEPWLRAHPDVRIATRDRSTDYRNALNRAAPQAVQVTDRFHLLMNARQLADRVTAAAYPRLKQLPDPPHSQKPDPLMIRTPSEQKRWEATRQRRLDLYHEVQRLKQAGVSVSKICVHLHRNFDTVRFYYDADTFPEKMPGRTPHSLLKPYVEYLEQRYAQGANNAAALFAELKAQGYPGKTAATLDRWLKAKRLLAGENPNALYTGLPVTNHVPLPSSHHLSWLLVLPPQRLDPDGQQWLAHLCKDPLMAQCYTLLQDFRQLLHTRAVTDLNAWLARAGASPLPQLRSFANGLREDYDSVRAALDYPWSNGQTEGQVNRLKFIKRQMYGRASFALLRQKVLYQPGST